MKKLPLLFLLFILSCQSAPTTTVGGVELTAKSSPGTTEGSALKGKQISDGVGQNSDPSFSPAGQLLVFVSRKRPEHPQAQIYELNLATHRERRLTFQNGDSFSPAFHPSAPRFFYSSNTDRLKEESYYLDTLKSMYSAKTVAVAAPVAASAPAAESAKTDLFDYFSSGLDGREIQKVGAPTLRATSRSLVSVTASPDGKHLVLTAGGLWLTDVAGFEARKLSNEAVSHARFSPDGKTLIWSEMTADGGARLMTRAVFGAVAATVLLETPGVRYLMPSWNPKNPNEIIFSSDRDSVHGAGPLKSPQFDLYVLELEAKCLKRLTETSAADETDPVFKPDGSGLVFTSTSGGSAQIYMAEYKSPAACLPLTP